MTIVPDQVPKRRIPRDPGTASVRARVAALTRWSKERPDNAAMRAGWQAKLEEEADPTGTLPETERKRRVAALRKLHYARMALARREKGARACAM